MPTNNRYKGSFLQFDIWWTIFTEYIPYVVPRFLLNPFCSSESCASYHGLIHSNMTLMISLHTVDTMLNPLNSLGSDFDSFPFQRVLSLELPQTTGKSSFEHRLFAILWISWSICGCWIFFSSSGSTSLLAFPDFNWLIYFWISSMVGISWLMGKLFEIFCNSPTNSGRLPLLSWGVTELTRLFELKCFFEMVKGFQSRILFLGSKKIVYLVLCCSQVDWS